MRYLRDLLPVFAALIFAVAVVGLTGKTTVEVGTENAPVSVSTTTLPAAVPVAEEAATTTATTSPAAPAAIPDTRAQLTAAGGRLLNAVVNIICIPRGNGTLRAISGSGVIIDPRGLIITAAHVGQYFLLRDDPTPGNVSCVIRKGSPASDAYTADPVYISPAWIEHNPTTLSESEPKGTGEDDFAILAITGSATDAPLPASFPYLPLSAATPKVGEQTAIGSYAAQYLGTKQIENQLYPTLVFEPITDRFTFTSTSVDVVSISGTPAAQEGSSGGGVVDAAGNLIGLITTSSTSGGVASRTLHAITPLHIRTSFAADMGIGLDTYLASTDIPALVAQFKAEANDLGKFLAAAQ